MTIAPTIRPVRLVLVVTAVLVLVALHLARLRRQAEACCPVERDALIAVRGTSTTITHFHRNCFTRRLVTHPARQHYLVSVPRDGWNRPLRLVCPSRHAGSQPCDVSSAGGDGIFGTGDDINSWEL